MTKGRRLWLQAENTFTTLSYQSDTISHFIIHNFFLVASTNQGEPFIALTLPLLTQEIIENGAIKQDLDLETSSF